MFLDLGAADGFYSRAALRALPDDGIVVAFEPVPGDELFRLAALNQRLTIRTEALGKADADRPFAFGPATDMHRTARGYPSTPTSRSRLSIFGRWTA